MASRPPVPGARKWEGFKMWFRCTQNEKPLMVNAEKVIKIVPTGHEDARGSHLFISPTEYIEVDEGLREMMTFLGFERRE
ncbi:MAG TPA: hypothetical protein VMU16_03715 [Candidatus Binataceae bacterium]|nr:hypothetical protein [Candidatus Binataceae bacterium]